MYERIEHRRIKELFANLELLVADPQSEMPEIRHELDSLRARLAKLEASISEAETHFTKPDTTAAENRSRQVEEITQQTAQQNWENFLDAIHRPEAIGYAYNQSDVESFVTPVNDIENGYQETINVLDENIGKLIIKGENGRSLDPEDKELINAVAKQVGQQVESLRLLADASRARLEAENATRRLTRENWQDFASELNENQLGYVYDSLQVTPLSETTLHHELNFVKPLVIQGESIGQLGVAGVKTMSPEDVQLLSSLAEQVSTHLETLRLNAELQRRARELQELDRLKSAFLANMSHELRTPLNSILGFSDVMLEGLDGALTENMKTDLSLIQKNGQHLLHLINDVLDMAKIESGRMNLHPETFTVYNVLEDVMSITSALANEKSLQLVIDSDADQSLEIYADTTRMRQVLINLINNAIKFTEHGSIRLNVQAVGSHYALITVKDSGLGIPADELESIFHEFTQVDTSTTRKVGGTGLGLPISRRLVELHGGKVWAESTGVHGEGSTFYVELPIQAQLTTAVEKVER